MKPSHFLPAATRIWVAALLLFGSHLYAAPTVYEQLCDLNAQWRVRPSTDPYLQQSIEFADHERLIRLHLMTVESTLRRADLSRLNADQRTNRSHCLDLLRDYWKAGVFPKNTYHDTTIPYFIDRYNTACAVGHLIRETGYEALACRIADEMNYAYIAQMPYAELPQWADKMGFAVAELKWIQPAYAPPLAISTNTTDANCGDNNGSITTSVTETLSGNPTMPDNPRWYSLSGGMGLVGNSSNIENLRSGLYKMQIDGGGGMFAYIDHLTHISDTDAPQVAATIQHESCSGSNDGSISLDITGGAAPYTVIWYNQYGNMIGNGAQIGHLGGEQPIGMFLNDMPCYICDVTDANGCKRLATYSIQTLNQNANYAWAQTQHPTCGNSNGSIQLQYYLPNSTFVWAHDPTLTSDIANNLPAGHYTVMVDAPGACGYEVYADLYHNAAYPINFSSSFVNQPTYCGLNIGSIICPEGYSYTWSHNANLNSNEATQLAEGYYTVTLTNINGCKYIYTTYVNTYDGVQVPFEVQLTNANTQNGQSGAIVLNTDMYEYSYAWSHDAGLGSSSATDLVAGTYSVTITGDHGCNLVKSYIIYDESQLSSGIHLPQVMLNAVQVGEDLRVSYTASALLSGVQVSVYDLNGRAIAQANLPAHSTDLVLPLSNAPFGVYILELRSQQAQYSRRIVWQ